MVDFRAVVSIVGAFVAGIQAGRLDRRSDDDSCGDRDGGDSCDRGEARPISEEQQAAEDEVPG